MNIYVYLPDKRHVAMVERRLPCRFGFRVSGFVLIRVIRGHFGLLVKIGQPDFFYQKKSSNFFHVKILITFAAVKNIR